MEASAFGINKGSSCDTVAVKMLKGMGFTGKKGCAPRRGSGTLGGAAMQEQEGKHSGLQSQSRFDRKPLGIRSKPLPGPSASVRSSVCARDSVRPVPPAPAQSMPLLNQYVRRIEQTWGMGGVPEQVWHCLRPCVSSRGRYCQRAPCPDVRAQDPDSHR